MSLVMTLKTISSERKMKVKIMSLVDNATRSMRIILCLRVLMDSCIHKAYGRNHNKQNRLIEAIPLWIFYTRPGVLKCHLGTPRHILQFIHSCRICQIIYYRLIRLILLFRFSKHHHSHQHSLSFHSAIV